MKYDTRYAPSPTGMLHIGGVRTALFCYLAARGSEGKFYLRIEDTDRERFVEGAVEAVHEGLSWLGLEYDGEVVYQSDRTKTYQDFANQLVSSGAAYKCFCTPERLTKLKEDQEKAKLPPVYDRCCLALTEDEVQKKEKAGDKYVIRFRIPPNPTEVSWSDKVRNKIAIPTRPLEDFIIIKSDGWPTYNFANVIDDHEMGITLVIRGDEFVPSTPKHILLYQALGWRHPDFAHVPVIVGEDMKKLSKRNGDTSLTVYRDNGYLPEALINFLAFLGWNPGNTQEIFTLEELKRAFSINRVGKAPAVFDVERLNYINGVYIRNLSVSELADRLIEFENNTIRPVISGRKPGISLVPSFSEIDRNLLEKVVSVEQTRIKTLAEFVEISTFYWELPKYSPDILIFKKSSPEATKKGLEAFVAIVSDFTETSWAEKSVEEWNTLLSEIVEKNSLGNADLFWPIRVALSGLDKSPSPAELLWVLGKEEAMGRIQKAL